MKTTLSSVLIALTFSAPVCAGDIFVCTKGNSGATPQVPAAGFYFELPKTTPRPNPWTVRFRGAVKAMPNASSLVGQVRFANGATFEQRGLLDMALGVTQPDGGTQTLSWVSSAGPSPYTFLGVREGRYEFNFSHTTYFCTESFSSFISLPLHNRLETF